MGQTKTKPTTTSLILPTDRLRPDPANVRTAEQGVKALAASMKLVGCLLPLRVRPHVARDDVPLDEKGEVYIVIDGHMRLLAAQKAKIAELPCLVVDTAEADAVQIEQAAANMVRADMTQPDIWQAVSRIVAGGRTVKYAAAALGLDARTTTRMERLGQLPTEILDVIRSPEVEMPDDGVLALMLMRPRAALMEAWGETKGEVVRCRRWWPLESKLRVDRVRASKAIFDLADHPEIPWVMDLFADKDEATTEALDLFMAAQMKALAAKVEWLRTMGVLCQLVADPVKGYGDPPGPADHERVYSRNRDEEIFGITHFEPGLMRVYWLSQGSMTPDVTAWRPKTKEAAASAAATPTVAKPEAGPITKKGQEEVEKLQRQAVGDMFAATMMEPYAREVALTLGLMLAERIGCTVAQRDALVTAFNEGAPVDTPLPDALGQIMRKALMQDGYGAGHAIGTVHAIGQMWKVTPRVSWGADELGWLKKGELEQLGNRLRVEAPVNATAKVVRKAILDKAGDGRVVTLSPIDLPLLGWKPEWPFTLSRSADHGPAGPEDEDEDRDPDDDTGDHEFSDAGGPLDDDEGAALASAYGPND